MKKVINIIGLVALLTFSGSFFANEASAAKQGDPGGRPLPKDTCLYVVHGKIYVGPACGGK